MDNEKARFLQSLHLLGRLPESRLEELGRYLKRRDLAEGEKVFEEGSRGESLFFIVSGHVRISKKISGASKDLAILGPGDCFGEMALVDEAPRSASGTAQEPVVLFELGRKDLDAWLKANPALAVGFLAELVQVQSRRLRRTSRELALLFDLSSLLLEPLTSGKELLEKALGRLLPHLEGSWGAAAYLYNPFNEETEFAAAQGVDPSALRADLPNPSETRSAWLDPGRYYVSLPGKQRPLGSLVFKTEHPGSEDERQELGRTLATVAQLLSTALDNINFRNEELLRARLKSAQAYGSGI